MKRLTIQRYGGPEVLSLTTAPDPAPARGEVAVRVIRAGLNFADVAARVGLYPDAPKPPTVVGYEVAGEVAEVGPEVQGLAPGTRVLALTHFGGHADRVCVPAAYVRPLPASMGFDEAAALPVNYLTAYHMLFHVARLRPKDRVLVHMAAGGVGLAVLQLLQRVDGVEVFGTASAAKHAFLREAGCHHPIDYRTQDYAEEVRRHTGGKGIQLVLDPLGGPDWKKGYGLLAPAGHLIAYGWSNMVSGTTRNPLRIARQFVGMPRFSPMSLMDQNRSVSGVNMGHLWGEAHLILPELEALLQLYVEGRIKPHVDKVFPLSKGADAHRYIQERKNVGKVLLDATA